MPDQLKDAQIREVFAPLRDGQSQPGRSLPALQPSYVAIDERDIAAYLEFARAYGKHLLYYGTDGSIGTWDAFIGSLQPRDVAAFLARPGDFQPDNPDHAPLFRPHFSLFLCFLHLLQQVQGELNELTARHLRFYFDEVLRMGRRPATPDLVHLVVSLAKGAKEAELPAGLQLSAGPDANGRPQIYATQGALIVNRAGVGALRSLFIERKRTTLAEIPRRTEDKSVACEAMFRLVLGRSLSRRAEGATPAQTCYELLRSRRQDLARRSQMFRMSVAQMRDLLARTRHRAASLDVWGDIYRTLETAAKVRKPGYALPKIPPPPAPSSAGTIPPHRFDEIALQAFGPLPADAVAKSLDGLYEQRDLSVAQDLIARLGFASLAQFEQMMLPKRQFEAAWREINRLIEAAGQRRKSDFTLAPAPDAVCNFVANLQRALDLPDAGSADLASGYERPVQDLEELFLMPAESFIALSDELLDDNRATAQWRVCLPILQATYERRVHADRVRVLTQLRKASPPASLVDLIRHVIGDPAPDADNEATLRALEPYLAAADYRKLQPYAQAEPAAAAWDALLPILAVAQRNRWGVPPAEVEQWINIHPAADATSVRAEPPVGDAGRVQSWLALGAAPTSYKGRAVPEPVLGWALTSPLLSLSTGSRHLTLTLGFAAESPPLHEVWPQAAGDLAAAIDSAPFCFEVSTADGFLALRPVAIRLGTYAELRDGKPAISGAAPDALQIKLELPDTAPAIVAAPIGGRALSDPTLRVMLRSLPIRTDAGDRYGAQYPAWASRRLLACHLAIAVQGLGGLTLASDDRPIDPRKPFEPFGSQPAAGSRFMIGHPELVSRPLDSIAFSFSWLAAPADLQDHYRPYGIVGAGPLTFAVGVCLVDGGQSTELADRDGKKLQPLFAGPGQTQADVQIRVAVPDTLDPASAGAGRLPADVTAWRRRFEWVLGSPDFQHATYAGKATEYAVKLAVAIASGDKTLKPENYQIKPPYTPKLKRLSLGYTTSVELRFDAASVVAGASGRQARCLHIHPFGFCPAVVEAGEAALRFLPRYESDGELYIALRDAQAGQTVSLLFQVAEGSADPDLRPPKLGWSVLDGNRWQPLDRYLIADATRGLLTSGIVLLTLPPCAPSTLFPEDGYVLRLALPRDVRSVCEILQIHTQAVLAKFVDGAAASAGGAPAGAGGAARATVSLPPLALKKLPHTPVGIAGVQQPYASFDGRAEEAGALRSTRISERLRHKGRALTGWDYEHLVLAEFPEIYKAKCLPAQSDSPGQVRLVVIPDLRARRPSDALTPKAPAALLGRIAAYLAAHAPVHAGISVTNARFIAVSVRLGVRFKSSGNDDFYRAKLNEELRRFLSPWAYEESSDIAIGGRIHANRIVDFVERRDYVDYVGRISLFTSEGDGPSRPVMSPGAAAENLHGYFVEPGVPEGVLVTAPLHQIDVLSGSLYQNEDFTGIGYCKIELDFAVG